MWTWPRLFAWGIESLNNNVMMLKSGKLYRIDRPFYIGTNSPVVSGQLIVCLRVTDVDSGQPQWINTELLAGSRKICVSFFAHELEKFFIEVPSDDA